MPANIKKFTEDYRVLQVLNDLEGEAYKNATYSDIIDDEGNQYVDLVLEGGGVLGMALIGYIYILERMNIRFMGLGGTSAGSIVTLLMACGKMNEAKSEWIIYELSKLDFNEFLDFHNGDRDEKILVQLLEKNTRKMKKIFNILCLLDNIIDGYDRKGLVKGDAFKSWLQKIISEKGVKSVKDIKEIRNFKPKGLRKREDSNTKIKFEFDEKCQRIAIIAADITTESKIEFPRMAHLYWKDPDKINPVEFVRASMSIPMLFNPYEIKDIEHNPDIWKKWGKEVNYRGRIPDKVFFVDGGIISNFPINVFHKSTGMPSRPTFGVKLGEDRDGINEVRSLVNLLTATFNTARHSLDNDYIFNNSDYNQIVTYINTNKFNWLNFDMSEDEKVDLFAEGALAAGNFLKRFSWVKYKQMREALADLNDKEKPAAGEPAKPKSFE
ncbi:MAG: patatin-like phospholipase family protein [Bacteroidota bacterium]|nr:patatin-like phospholipase family protein [Bacteroidota bacterium]